MLWILDFKWTRGARGLEPGGKGRGRGIVELIHGLWGSQNFVSILSFGWKSSQYMEGFLDLTVKQGKNTIFAFGEKYCDQILLLLVN